MEGDLREVGEGRDGDEIEVLSGLSTVLVATIQEVKDRISHIEFIFCNQLFPRVRSRSRSIQKQISVADVREASEGGWRRKEASLLRQIEEIRLQKEQAEEETRRAICSLDRERAEKARILEKLENAERTREIVAEGLRNDVRVRSDEVRQCKQVQETLLRQIEELRVQKEKAEEETRRTVDSLQREGAEQEELHEAEKARILERLESAEKTNEIVVADLRDQVRIRSDEVRHCKQLQETLLRQIDLKDLALSEERSKVKKLSSNWGKLEERYKQLKSQYRFLLRKTGLTGETSDVYAEGGLSSPISLPQKRKCPQGKQIPSNSHESEEGAMPLDLKIKDPTTTPVSVKAEEPADQMIDDRDLLRSLDSTTSYKHDQETTAPRSTAHSPWVDTRGRQSPGGADPHDDFLDTPMDAIRATSKQKSGDETEIDTKEMDAAANKLESRSGRGFKFIESVRKKAERENLKGIECKQCKKFYDAVLPSDRVNPSELRCEHHEGVSRHRYRHPPPMTPEGFWNIGFDSET